MGPYINNHMKYIALMLCVLLSSCMTIPTVTTKPAAQPVHLEPITSDTFSQADTDNDGKLTQAEAKNLPKLPTKQTDSSFIWAFISIILCVSAVCVIAQYSARRKQLNT